MLGETMAKIRAKDKEDAKLEGWKESMKEVARKMFKKGCTVELISSVTEIPTSDLEKMKAEQV